MEHRWGERSQVAVKVRLFAPGPDISRLGCILDISASGAFIETRLKPQLLQRLQVEVRTQTSTGRERVIVPACVVRRTAVGLGVEWCESLAFAIPDQASVLPIFTHDPGETRYAHQVLRSRSASHGLVLPL